MAIKAYITPEEASELIASFLGSEALTNFTKMSETVQRATILQAQLILEGLPWRGVKLDEDQREAWPRRFGERELEAPDAVKLALVFQIAEKLQETTQAAQLADLSAAGVASYAIDDLSISFKADTLNNAKARSYTNFFEGLAPEALRLLRPYLLLGGACDVYA